jgi:hypothetical protein
MDAEHQLAVRLAIDCLTAGWEVDDVGALIAPLTGLPVRDAWGVAYAERGRHARGDAQAERAAAARLSEFGIPLPDPHPRTDRATEAEMLSGAIGVARELVSMGRSEGAVARTLVEEYFLTPSIAATAAAVATTDPR